MTTEKTRIIRCVAEIADPYRWGPSLPSFAVTSDCRHIAVQPTHGFDSSDERYDQVYVYDFEGRLENAFRSSRGREEGIIFWPDDFHLLMGGWDQGITVLHRSLLTGRVDRPFRDTVLDGTSQSLVGASAEGRFVAGYFSGANNQGSWFYDRATGTVTRLNLGGVTRAVFSSDHKYLAMIDDRYVTASDCRYLCSLIDISSGDLLFSVKSGQGTPSYARANTQVFLGFTHDNKYSVFGAATGIVLRILPSGDIVKTISGYSTMITAGAVSHDGRLCAMGAINGDIAVLSMDAYLPVVSYVSGSSPSYENAIRQIAVSRDNRRLVAINIDTIRTFNLSIS